MGPSAQLAQGGPATSLMGMSAPATIVQSGVADAHWSRSAVMYEVFVRGFYDASADGNGDLRGLTAKLDYLQWLGVDCLWLLPFYASPLRDGGYDTIVQPVPVVVHYAMCPVGKKVVGGGGSGEYLSGTPPSVVDGLADIIQSYPSLDPNAYWEVWFGRQDGLDFATGDQLHWNVYAICAYTAP